MNLQAMLINLESDLIEYQHQRDELLKSCPA